MGRRPVEAICSSSGRVPVAGEWLAFEPRLASVYELQIKMQLGKLALRLPLADVLRDQQQRDGLLLEPVTLEDILALSALPTLHRDPFDRLYHRRRRLCQIPRKILCQIIRKVTRYYSAIV